LPSGIRLARIARAGAVAVLVALAVASFVWMKEYQPVSHNAFSPVMPSIALRLEAARLAGRSHGRASWRFDAESVEVSRDRSVTILTGIRNGVVCDRAGAPQLFVTARRAVYRPLTEDILVEGGAKVGTREHLAIGSERLIWNGKEQRLTCPQRVTIDTGAGRGKADSLVVDLSKNELVARNISLKIPVKEEGL
jgi:LPS export ABC transporter protein LptC